MEEENIRPECAERFRRILDRLDDGDNLFSSHGERIKAVETNVDNVTKSLDRVAHALWGVAAASISILIGFVFWYIENKH